ncbi:MAG: DNA-processing protein DprA [Gammaproteobacteria bacterium]|jgi:DNA processing protein
MFDYLAQTDLKHYLAICHIPQMGSKRLAHLFKHFNSFAEILGSNHKTLTQLGFSDSLALNILKPDYSLAEQDLAWLNQASNRSILTLLDAEYPRQLKEIAAKPPVLYAEGRKDLLYTQQIAIVGSRNPTTMGLTNTQILATDLAKAGYTITSGLALGIDAKAHQAALSLSKPTIAVLGTGLKHIYPKRNERLSKEIAENGLLISEFPVNTAPKAENFPRRNRIISGLSLGVLVIEAALKSGSLITARYAIEQNREVFAVPGSIQNPLARGCHALIRQGAKLVETVNDINEEFSGIIPNAVLKPAAACLSLVEKQVLNLIQHSPLPFDCLVEQSNLSVQELSAAITQLEVQGLIQVNTSGYIHFSEQTYETQCA